MAVKLIEIRENEKDILKICDAAAQRLDREESIQVTPSAGLATTAYVYLREAINSVSAKKSSGSENELDVMGLFVLGVTYRENEEAEKEGNYTPYIKPSTQFELLVNEGKIVEPKEFTKEEIKVGEAAYRVMKLDRGIDGNDAATVSKMARSFFVELILYLNENRSKEEDFEINLLQLADIGIVYDIENEKFVAVARPGQEYKLLVKDDDSTEE